MSVFMKASAFALKEQPVVNAVIDVRAFDKIAGYIDFVKTQADAEIIVGGNYLVAMHEIFWRDHEAELEIL